MIDFYIETELFPPSEEDIQEIINEYTAFGEDSFATKMQQIINEDIFQKADENLNDLLQF